MGWYAGLSVLEQVFLVSGATGTLIFLIRIILMLMGLEHAHDSAGHLPDSTGAPDALHGGALSDGASSDAAGTDVVADGSDLHDGSDVGHGVEAEASQGGEVQTSSRGEAHAPQTGWNTLSLNDILQIFSIQTLSTFFMMFGWFGLAFYRGLRIEASISLPVALAGGFGSVYLLGLGFRAMHRLEASGNVRVWTALQEHGHVYLSIPEGGVGQVQVPVDERLRVLDAVSHDGSPLESGQPVEVVDIRDERVLVVKPLASLPHKT